MRIKRKPVAPIRKSVKKTKYLEDFANVLQLVTWCEDMGLALGDTTIEQYYDGSTELVWTSPESDASFDRRLAKYHMDLEVYSAWYKQNQQEIEEELDRRAIAQEKKNKVQIKKLEAQLAKYKAEISRAELSK